MDKQSSRKLLLRILLSTLLGLVLIVIWSRFVDPSELLRRLREAKLETASLFFVLFIISGTGRGFRLKILLKDYQLLLKDVVMLTFLGQFLSFFIPVRAGEITKSVYLTSRYSLPLGKTITWIFIDRFLDFLAVLLLIAWLIFLVPHRLPANTPILAVGLFALFVLFFIAAVLAEQLLKRTLRLISGLLVLPKLKAWFISFSFNIVEGFEVLRQGPLNLGAVALLTVFVTLSDSLMWYFIFRAVGIDISFLTSLLGNCLSALTFLVPSTPGYVGSAEAAATGIFAAVLGIDVNSASAAAVLMHLVTAVALLVAGITALYFLDFDLGTVWKKIRS